MRVLILILSFLFAFNALIASLAHGAEVFPGYTKLSPIPNTDYFTVEKCNYTPGEDGCVLLAHLTKTQVNKLKNQIWWSAFARDAVVGTIGAAAVYYIYVLNKAPGFTAAQENRRYLAKHLRDALKSNKPLMFLTTDGVSDLLQDHLKSLLKTDEQFNFSSFQGEAP